MIIAGLSVVLILGGLRSEKKPSAEIPSATLITALVITVAVAVTDFVGIFPALFLVSVVLPLCWKEQRLHFIVLLALSLPTSIYLIFTIILGVQFPHGLIADAFS